MPQPTIDLEAITAHLSALADTQWCPRCDHAITDILTDATHLLSALARLYDELAAARLDNANLHAAIRAALGAAADGEADPLAFLRWELSEQENQPPGSGGGRCA